MADLMKTRLIVGLEVHVELGTRTKMFTRTANPARVGGSGGTGGLGTKPNTLIDPVVLALPGALPVLNKEAVRMSIMVGLALNCSIAPTTRWDRKSYFYPDLPKNYQISQYDLPVCMDGAVDLPGTTGGATGDGEWDFEIPSKRIGIIRAHLEEDAGKLLHEAPGGGSIDFSIADYNRAGTPLLEIVTQPDFAAAVEVVAFCRMLRNACRFLGVTEGILQEGQMRFEPNINCELTLSDGRTVRTPVVEVKNLNSFNAVRGAIEYELREQPKRWQQDGREMGAGAKQTRGWDDERDCTTLQREKEDAHDYRYFPDPDLLPVTIEKAWVEEIRASIPELPLARQRRFMNEFGLSGKEAAALVDEREVCRFYERAIEEAVASGVARGRAGKAVANVLLQSGSKRANERGEGVLLSDLGIHAAQVGGLVKLREAGAINNQSMDELFGYLCDASHAHKSAEQAAGEKGMLVVRDDGAVDAWCEKAISENAKAAEDVRAGKDAAIGRLVGAAMKHAAGKGDAALIKARLLSKLGRA